MQKMEPPQPKVSWSYSMKTQTLVVTGEQCGENGVSGLSRERETSAVTDPQICDTRQVLLEWGS